MALNMVTIHGLLRHPDNVTAQRGKAIFTPGTGILVDSADGTVLAGSIAVPIADDGTFTPILPATDNAGTQPLPNTWNWTVRFELYDDVLAPFSFALPASPSTVNFADLVRVLPAPGTYLIIPGPKGDPGGAGDGALLAANNLSDVADPTAARGHLGLGTAATAASSAFDTAGAASSAQTAAGAYADGKINAEVARANSAYDPAGAASAAQTAAATDATTKVAAEVTRANSTYLAKANDLADLHDALTARTNLGLGSAAAQNTTAFDAAGTAAAGDATTLAAAKAYTDAHAGGGGSSIVTRKVRIIDDDDSGLPSAASWAIVQTVVGTKLQCSIPAVAGDRIKVYGRFMRTGSHFLDWVLLDSAGAIATYSISETGTPGPEGNPTLYPSLSISYATSAEMFTVSAGNISAGSITVALAHQGTGAGIVYAHPFYPWRVRLENIGPEPA